MINAIPAKGFSAQPQNHIIECDVPQCGFDRLEPGQVDIGRDDLPIGRDLSVERAVWRREQREGHGQLAQLLLDQASCGGLGGIHRQGGKLHRCSQDVGAGLEHHAFFRRRRARLPGAWSMDRARFRGIFQQIAQDVFAAEGVDGRMVQPHDEGKALTVGIVVVQPEAVYKGDVP